MVICITAKLLIGSQTKICKWEFLLNGTLAIVKSNNIFNAQLNMKGPWYLYSELVHLPHMSSSSCIVIANWNAHSCIETYPLITAILSLYGGEVLAGG